MRPSHLGYQKTIDLYGCNSDSINSKEFVENTLLKATVMMNLSVVNSTFHEFSPIGISGVIVIKESHIAIHSWPEYGYIAIDIFTCNPYYNLEDGIDFLKKEFNAQKIIQEDTVRGDLTIVERFDF